MRANVYALIERRQDRTRESMDLWMVGGSFQELYDYYLELKGRATVTVSETVVDGHSVWTLDEDAAGAAYISQYKVGITEVLDDTSPG